MLRWGVGLVVVALAGWFVAVPIWLNHQQRVWSPLDTPLRVLSGQTETGDFSVAPNTPYEIFVYVKRFAPFGDCLLGGGVATSDSACSRHHSVIDISWSLRNEQGQYVAGGVSAGTCCDYEGSERPGGERIGTKLGGFVVPRKMKATLLLRYRRNASALREFSPQVAIEVDSQVTEMAGVLLGLIYALLAAIGAFGLAILAVLWIRNMRREAS